MEEAFTTFEEIYSCFESKITDDMYIELSKEETSNLELELMNSALFHFEFPRQDIFNKNEELSEFNLTLTPEEINIIATYMVVEWLGQQLASVENTRMKYSGTDFKFTSQANHMHKIMQLKEKYKSEGFKLQRLYKRRRKDKQGIMRSTFGDIMSTSVRSSYDN